VLAYEATKSHSQWWWDAQGLDLVRLHSADLCPALPSPGASATSLRRSSTYITIPSPVSGKYFLGIIAGIEQCTKHAPCLPHTGTRSVAVDFEEAEGSVGLSSPLQGSGQSDTLNFVISGGQQGHVVITKVSAPRVPPPLKGEEWAQKLVRAPPQVNFLSFRYECVVDGEHLQETMAVLASEEERYTIQINEVRGSVALRLGLNSLADPSVLHRPPWRMI
jgi:hypothetical protein